MTMTKTLKVIVLCMAMVSCGCGFGNAVNESQIETIKESSPAKAPGVEKAPLSPPPSKDLADTVEANNSSKQNTATAKYVRLSFIQDAAGSMGVTWHSDAPMAPVVRYGQGKSKLDKTASGTSNFTAQDVFGVVYQVRLTDLIPDTRYYYALGEADTAQPIYSFVTGKKVAGKKVTGKNDVGKMVGGNTPDGKQNAGKPFAQKSDSRKVEADSAPINNRLDAQFVLLGDSRFGHTDGTPWRNVLENAVAHDPAFIVHAGDVVNFGDRPRSWLNWLEKTDDLLATVPFMTAIGNHDLSLQNYYQQLFLLPKSTGKLGSNTSDYYFFTYNDVVVISLSTESFKEGDGPFARQAAWLDDVLTNHGRKWKIVMYHNPSYSQFDEPNSYHGPNYHGQNAAFVPVMDKHKVDLVLNGHLHWYERFLPSACSVQGAGDSSVPCVASSKSDWPGSTYVVSGGAGAPLLPKRHCSKVTGGAVCKSEFHYILATTSKNELRLKTYSVNQSETAVIDKFVIKKQ